MRKQGRFVRYLWKPYRENIDWITYGCWPEWREDCFDHSDTTYALSLETLRYI